MYATEIYIAGRIEIGNRMWTAFDRKREKRKASVRSEPNRVPQEEAPGREKLRFPVKVAESMPISVTLRGM